MLPEIVELPSERKFGLFFSFVFILIALYSAYSHGIGIVCVIAALISLAFLIAALLMPTTLQRLNKGWAYIGLLLGLIISPIVLGVIYFGLFTPVAEILRLKGRDELRLKNKALESHWIVRDPKGPSPSSYKDQF